MQSSSRSHGLAVFLSEHRDGIARAWLDAVASASRGRFGPAEAEHDLLPMLDALIVGVRSGTDVQADAFDEVRALLREYSRTRARNGFSPSETASAIFVLRDAVFSAAHGTETAFAELMDFSRVVDGLGLVTFEAFAQAREAVIVNQTEQLLELSTPVVKLWDGVLAVPLVGTLDSARTQVVMESLLQLLVTTGSAHAIIDITGVAAVDTQVAQHLLKTVLAARLMGADCIISGIRPQIAQTIVNLGIEFGETPTKATLADALRLTFKRAGLEVRPIAARA
jgi:rsbT co-antagonist protein RsbR